MARSSVDLAFLHFQKTGDVDALSKVFDGTASRLMVVARNLTDDIHSAEDLVQATYLVAIERHATYQPKATVLSWLLGLSAVGFALTTVPRVALASAWRDRGHTVVHRLAAAWTPAGSARSVGAFRVVFEQTASPSGQEGPRMNPSQLAPGAATAASVGYSNTHEPHVRDDR